MSLLFHSRACESIERKISGAEFYFNKQVNQKKYNALFVYLVHYPEISTLLRFLLKIRDI
ncbi:hypothetical protein KL86DYS2_10154 [uncultured Dysgonomonas sp.]|uniref:Uncharacterized protein n=1 Tax=uncultured Dysgonomonas sp. TaxID=206096 RepID=A0A212IVM8_9BACT|nr:hypothetical protein KL86DYS2_10154 [uncultured Dysgonomonas sp.]